MCQRNVGMVRLLCIKTLEVTGKRNRNQMTALSSGTVVGFRLAGAQEHKNE